MGLESINLIKEQRNLPLCLSKAKISKSNQWIYGAPVPSIMTLQYRSAKYFKPVSRLISLTNVADGKK